MSGTKSEKRQRDRKREVEIVSRGQSGREIRKMADLIIEWASEIAETYQGLIFRLASSRSGQNLSAAGKS